MQRREAMTSGEILWPSLAIAFVFAFVLGFVVPAKATSPSSKGRIAESVISSPQDWGGCGVGVGGGLIHGQDSYGGPPDSGSGGQVLGVRLLCDAHLGGFVIGANVDYDRFFGDAETMGVESEWSGGGRAGVLLNSATLLYATGGYARLMTTDRDFNGWYMGGGIESKLPSAPLYLSLEYRHTIYEVDGPLESSADKVRLGLTYKFNVFGK